MYRLFFIVFFLSSINVAQTKVGFGFDLDAGNKAAGIGTNIVLKQLESDNYFIVGFGVHTSYLGDKKPTNISPLKFAGSTEIQTLETAKTYFGLQVGVSSNNFLFSALVDYCDYQKYTTYNKSNITYSVADENLNRIFFGAGIQYIYKGHALGLNFHSGRQFSLRYSAFFL